VFSTPSPLRGTPSINRGRVFLYSSPVYRGGGPLAVEEFEYTLLYCSRAPARDAPTITPSPNTPSATITNATTP